MEYVYIRSNSTRRIDSSGRYQITTDHLKSEKCKTTRMKLQTGINLQILWRFPAEAQRNYEEDFPPPYGGPKSSQRGVCLYSSSRITENYPKRYLGCASANAHMSRTLFSRHCCLTSLPAVFPQTQSFQVCVPGNIVFNQENSVDLMALDKLPYYRWLIFKIALEQLYLFVVRHLRILEIIIRMLGFVCTMDIQTRKE